MVHALVLVALVGLVLLPLAALVIPVGRRVEDETMPRASRPDPSSPQTWALYSSYLPTWAVFVGVVFLPLGLLARLARVVRRPPAPTR